MNMEIHRDAFDDGAAFGDYFTPEDYVDFMLEEYCDGNTFMGAIRSLSILVGILSQEDKNQELKMGDLECIYLELYEKNCKRYEENIRIEFQDIFSDYINLVQGIHVISPRIAANFVTDIGDFLQGNKVVNPESDLLTELTARVLIDIYGL